MPKIIENLRCSILQTGKQMLLQEGYAQMTLRRVASACGIAAGTIYNYYPSKEMLAATIMLEDWQRLLGSAEAAVESAVSPLAGMEAVFAMIRAYAEIYRGVWDGYSGAMLISGQRHGLLIGQLAALIRRVLERFDLSPVPDPCVFLAEILLHAGIRQETAFSTLSPFLEKLLL